MTRPIGVTLLAVGAGSGRHLRAVAHPGVPGHGSTARSSARRSSFSTPQWGQAIWALILAAIWFWIAEGFWNVRAYAWSFGIFISLFTLIFGFFAILGSTTFEEEFVPMFLAFLIFFYLNYPGVQKQFVEHEMSLLTPEQRAAIEQVQAANAAAARAMATPAAPAAPAPTHPAAVPAGRAAVGRGTDRVTTHPTRRSGDAIRSTRPIRAPAGRSRHVTGRASAPRLDARRRLAGRGSNAAVDGQAVGRRRARRCPAPSGTRSAGAWRRRRCVGRRARSRRRASARRRGPPRPRGSRSPRRPASVGSNRSRSARASSIRPASNWARARAAIRSRWAAGSTSSPSQATGPDSRERRRPRPIARAARRSRARGRRGAGCAGRRRRERRARAPAGARRARPRPSAISSASSRARTVGSLGSASVSRPRATARR